MESKFLLGDVMEKIEEKKQEGFPVSVVILLVIEVIFLSMLDVYARTGKLPLGW